MSKYGDALDTLEQSRVQESVAVQKTAEQFNPDQYAQAITRGNELGLPANIIAKNPEPFNKPSKFGAALDRQAAPVTHEWFGSLDNAAVAQDDVEKLTLMEQLLGSVMAPVLPKDTARPFSRSAARLPTNIGKSAVAQTKEMFYGAERLFADIDEGMARSAVESYRKSGAMPPAQAQAAVDQALDRFTEARLRSVRAGTKAAEANAAGDAAIPKDAGLLERSIQQGASSALITAPAMLLLGPEAVLPIMGLGAGGSRYSSLLDKGVSKQDAALSGALIGSVEVLTEYLPGETLVKNVPGFWKHMAEFMISEIPGENIASVTELLDDYRLNLREDVTFADVRKTMTETTLATVFGGGTQITAAQIIKRLAKKTNEGGDAVETAESTKATTEQINAVAQESKLAIRSPEKLEELVAKIKESTGAEHAYIDPDGFRTLFQSDEEAAAAAAELTGSDQTYYEAAVSGSKMAVPIEKYVSKIATNKEATKLLDFVTFSDQGMTAAEAKESREGFDERVSAITQEAIDTTSRDTSEAVYNDVLGQLLQTGMERSTAEKNATLMQAVFRSLASRTGSDARALYSKYGVRIGRDLADGATRLDQSGYNQSVQPDASLEPRLLIEIHKVRDQKKLADLVSSMTDRGWQGRPALAWDSGNGVFALTGSHRLAAAKKTGQQVPVVYVDNKLFESILESEGLTADEVIGSGDDRVADLLRRAGDTRSADLMDQELNDDSAGIIPGFTSNQTSAQIQSGVDSSNGQPSRNSRNKADQDGLRTISGSKPTDGWQEATRIRGKSGKPLRLFRGGRQLAAKDFEDESLGKATGHPSSGLGVFFSNDQADAASYGDVSSAFLDIRKPKLIKVEDVPDFDSFDDAIAFREKLKAAGHDGIVIQASHLGGPNQVIAFAPEQVIVEPTTLDQRFEETRRGSIQFGIDRQFTISLFEKADLSTFLHESGHFYLEILGDLAQDENAPQQVKDDFAALLKWFGVGSREQVKTEQHEQFARGFEAYLMEGKAPSVELQSLFARFRAWLTAVYRTLSKLNVELTKEVRDVMDRIVATDEEIQAAETQQNYAPIFTTAEQAGMTEAQWSAYKDIATRAHQDATEKLTDQAMKMLKREQLAWWREERAKVLDEVTTEVNAQPVYQAIAFLQKGQQPDGSDLPEGISAKKLDKQSMVEKYGKDFLKRLPRGITGKDGLGPDIAGQMFGFDSGDALVEALANARPKNQLIEMEADSRMRDKYGDLMTDGSLAEEAMQSVHTDQRAKVLSAELKALNRKRREVTAFEKSAVKTEKQAQKEAREANAASLPDRDELKAIKAAVERIMQAKKVRDISPNSYRVAEAKAGRKAFEFAGKGKFEEAYLEKRKQILNHELYRAAVAAREEVDSVVEYMRTFDKKATRERIAKAKGQYLEQIDALRERFDFSNVSNIAGKQRDALSKWVAEQDAAGRETNIPEALLNEARRTPYKELLVAELQGLHDAIKNIEHLAKTKDRLLKNRKEADFQEAKSELLERVQTALPEGKDPPLGRFDKSTLDAVSDFGKGIADSFLRPETIIEWLDGGTEGPWHDYLWNQANDSQDRRESIRDRVAKPLFDLSQKINRKRRNELQAMVQIPSMGRALNRRTLISIALNMGNASNLDKLSRGGYRTKDGSTVFTDRNLQEIKDALTKEDWVFVQTVWDTVNQLWPDVVDFQKRMGGLVPEKIEAQPIKTKFGEMRGGYFPLVYDPEVSTQGEKQAAGDSAQEIMGNNFTRASTKKGHTKERTRVARPILLDFERVMTRHIDQVITDLSHREFLLQALKILDDGDLRAQIQNRIGDSAYRSLQGMVRHAVRADNYYGDPASSGWMKMQDYLIRNTAVAALGFRAVTAFGNLVLAPVQGAARIPPRHILKGLGEFYRHPKGMTAFIHSQSEFMKHRAENLDQTLVETMATLRGERSIRAQVARAAMAVHRWSDFLATHALWIGKYREILEGGGTAEDAQRQADKAIRQTQTAGAPKDLSAFERDPQYKAFRLFLGPMVIMGNRIRESVGRKGAVKNWPEAFGTLMAVWFVPALLWEIATGKGPDDEDEPEDVALWALRKEFFYPFMTIPFLRDIATYVERKTSGQYAPSRTVPLAEAGEVLFKAGEEAFKAGAALYEGDDLDGEALVKDSLRATGPLFGMPSGQLTVTGTYLYDVFSGDYDPEGVGDLRYLAIKRE